MEVPSTASSYRNVLNNLMTAETKQASIGDQISSEQVSTDLQGYASNAETLTALQSVQAQVTGYLSNSQTTAARLSTQDTALTQASAAATSASHAITTALAAGAGEGLMQSLQGALQNAVQGLNATFNGNFVFAGGNSSTAPVTASTLADLTAAPSIASVFTNGQYVAKAQLTSTNTVQTGQLADQLGTPLFTALKAVEAYDQGPSGPFGDPLTAAQATFLQGQIASFNTAATGLTTATSQNGEVQAQVASAQTALTDQQTSVNGLIGGITNVRRLRAVFVSTNCVPWCGIL